MNHISVKTRLSIFLLIVMLLSILSCLCACEGSGCDFPGCDEAPSHKGKYGGYVYLCDKHKNAWYYIDPDDGGVVFDVKNY